jgi:hypothetical protein
MKTRLGFVSNSSSSSFLVLYEVNYNDELKNFFKEEFGKYGLKLADEYIVKGDKIKESLNEITIVEDIEDELEEPLEENKYYIIAERMAYSDEGNIEGDDCWLVDHIPNEYIKNIYEGVAD